MARKPKKDPKAAADAAEARSKKAPKSQTVRAGPSKTSNDDQDRAAFLSHLKLIAALEGGLQKAKDALGLQYNKAKAEGFPKTDFKLVFKLQELDGERNKKSEIVRTLRVARWLAMDLGTQLDMFLLDERVVAEDRSYEEGKSRAMLGNTLKCDYAPDTEQYRSFAQGWHDGQAILSKGFKKLEVKVTKPKAEKADDFKPPVDEYGVDGAPKKPSNVVAMTRAEAQAQQAGGHKVN